MPAHKADARIVTERGEGPETAYRVPVLISRFPFRQHLEYRAIRADTEAFYYSFLHDIASRDFDAEHGAYIDTGASYSAYSFPFGDANKLMAVSRFFGPWSFIDDLIDNSLDVRHLNESIARYRAALGDPPVADGVFKALAEFFARPDWDPEALAFCKGEFHRYVDSTQRLRIVEIDRLTIPLTEYLDIRSTNCAMNFCFALAMYAMPNLTESFLDATRLPAFQRAWDCLNRSVGLLLDLYAGEALRPEICRYTHSVRIVQRDAPEPCTWQQAVDRVVALFYAYEAEADAELDRVALTHPDVARALRYTQGGVVLWMRDMRGLRYAPIESVQETAAWS